MLALGVAVLAAAWRAHLYLSGDPWLRTYIRTDARADALAVGAVLALCWQADRLPRPGPRAGGVIGSVALAGIVLAAAFLHPFDEFFYVGGFTLVAVAAAIPIASVLGSRPLADGLLARRPLVAVGRLSYPLYLWHFGIFEVVAGHTAAWPASGRVAFAWLLAFGAAAVSYRLVELPALRLKRRLGGHGLATTEPVVGGDLRPYRSV